MPVPSMPDVIGNFSASDAADKLENMGDSSTAFEIRSALSGLETSEKYADLEWPWNNKTPVHKYTSHAFGFIPMGHGSGAPVDIRDAGNIQADQSLRNARVRVTLDRLRVFDYPGKGEHNILFDFYARHQTAAATEDIRFNQVYRVYEGGGAGITGYPVFAGLSVGQEGIAFRCYTVNVENKDDKKILGFLDNNVFKRGLELLNTVNPVMPVVTQFATGITEAFAKRNENVPVQDFFMGLDFSGVQSRAQLAEGSYIAVQKPNEVWDWSRWVYTPSNGEIVSRDNAGQLIPYNYVVFSVSRMQ